MGILHAKSLLPTLTMLVIGLALGGCGSGTQAPLAVSQPAVFQIQITSVDSAGTPGNFFSDTPSISATGRFVAFESRANNLISGGSKIGSSHVFVRDTCIGASFCAPATTLVSILNDGSVADESSFAAISPDGRFVAFRYAAAGSFIANIFLRDTCLELHNCIPSTQLVSVADDGTPANAFSGDAVVAQGGRYIAFSTDASNLGTGGSRQVVVRDTCLGASSCTPSTHVISVAPDGTPGNGTSGFDGGSGSGAVSMTPDGRFVAFTSIANNMVPGGTNQGSNIFVRDTCAGVFFCTPLTTLVSVASGANLAPSISSDGRFVAFASGATILMRDTCLGISACQPSTTTVFSGGFAGVPAISGDGRFVIYSAQNQAFPRQQVFMYDTCLREIGYTPSTRIVSVSAQGTPNDGYLINQIFDFFPIALSSDGRAVAFTSSATNLVPGTQSNTNYQVYVAPSPFK